MKKIVIAGANGFLGRHLTAFLAPKYRIVALVRRKLPDTENLTYHEWDGVQVGPWQMEVEGAWALINLSGRSVDCRYNAKNRREILESRIQSTKALGEAIEACINPPKIWLNAASATIYRHSMDRPMDEAKGEIGEGFSVEVCKAWEAAFFGYAHPEMRQIALRTALVMDQAGGALPPLLNLVRLGLGGEQGSGHQMVSWIHIVDFCRAIEFLLADESLSGPVNVVAPYPDHNSEMMRILRQVVGRKWGLSHPKWLLEFGAWLIRTETELILKSRYVVPGKLLNAGFQFEFPHLENAFPDLLREARRMV